MNYQPTLEAQRELKGAAQPDPRWIAVMDPALEDKRLEIFAQDDAPVSLLERIAEHPNASYNLLKKLSAHSSSAVRSAVTENAHITETLILVLSADADPDVRFRIAENARSPLKVLKLLAEDENPYVAYRANATLARVSGAPSNVTALFSAVKAETGTEPGAGLFMSTRGTPESRGYEKEVRTIIPLRPMVNKQATSDKQLPCAEKLRILVIEDNPADTKLLQKSLSKWPFDLHCVDHLSAGLELLSRQPTDVVLLDLSLPDAQGIETFYLVHCQAPHVPVVVLTGLEDEAIGNEAVQLGAQDYLVKGQVTPGLLARAIKYAVERHESETKIKELNESLEHRVLQLAAANQDLEQLTQAMASSSAQARDLLDRLATVMYKEEQQPEVTPSSLVTNNVAAKSKSQTQMQPVRTRKLKS